MRAVARRIIGSVHPRHRYGEDCRSGHSDRPAARLAETHGHDHERQAAEQSSRQRRRQAVALAHARKSPAERPDEEMHLKREVVLVHERAKHQSAGGIAPVDPFAFARKVLSNRQDCQSDPDHEANPCQPSKRSPIDSEVPRGRIDQIECEELHEQVFRRRRCNRKTHPVAAPGHARFGFPRQKLESLGKERAAPFHGRGRENSSNRFGNRYESAPR